MIFNSKQLEELENIHDSTGAFEEEADDDAGFDDVGEAAMDWRRGLIEEAAESVKRAKTRPVDATIQYPVNSLLFDRDARRFGRVQRSVPGYLKIVYLSGGDREYGTLDVVAYLKEYGAQKRVSEMSEQLGLPDSDVALELDRLGITPLEEPEPTPEEQAAAEAPPPPLPAPAPRMPKAPKSRPKFEEESEDEDGSDEGEALADDDEDADAEGDEEGADAGDDDDLDLDFAAADDEDEGNGKKAKGAKAPPAKALDKRPPEKKAPVEARKGAPPPAKNEKKPPIPQLKEKAAVKPSAPPKVEAKKAPAAGGKGVNPIDDPNGFIRQNFQEMSNRELARLTGLSEHTIRRKLGEWGMKRKKGED